MNMQAIMKQAQKMQQDVMKEKKEIDAKVFTGKASNVRVEVLGSKKISKIEIDFESADKDDIEIIQDSLLVAINDAMNQIDVETESRLGKYTNGMQGLL